jgi:hypothetical protein
MKGLLYKWSTEITNQNVEQRARPEVTCYAVKIAFSPSCSDGLELAYAIVCRPRSDHLL